MAGTMAGLVDVEPGCAICGGHQYPECPHESDSLQLAVNQAFARWAGVKKIRDWVLDHARNEVLAIFQELKNDRRNQHLAYLQTIPCFSLYQKFHGSPPVHPLQLQRLQQQISQAQDIYKSGVDQDWQRSCMKYPDVLDHFFALVEIDFPGDGDSSIQDPRFGGAGKGTRKTIKARRSSRGSTDVSNGHRKKGRRRHSRGRTPVRR